MSYQTKVEGNTVIERTDPVKLIIDRGPNAHATFVEDEEVKRRLDEILIATSVDEARRASSVGTGLGLMKLFFVRKLLREQMSGYKAHLMNFKDMQS